MAEEDDKLRKTITSTIKSMASMDSAAKKSDGAIDTLAETAAGAASKLNRAFSDFVGNNTKVFQDLSNVGSSFGNSLNGIKIAAAESRLSLDEFTEILSRNNKNFVGLGANVAEGGKKFAEFSRQFMDSPITEKLSQMGYTAKDLNEVLALQLSISRSSAQDTEEGRKRTLESAGALAEQMDALAKLTGKSRKEQMESMAAQQADMQLEAALRRDTRNMSAAEAEEYKTKVRASIEYEKATRGEAAATMAKEYYATGTLMSDTARKYSAISGEASNESMKSMDAIKRRDYEAAEAHKKRADAETVALNDNQAYLDQVIYQTKVAGVVTETMKASQTMYEGTKKTLGDLNVNAANAAKALEENRKKIKEEQDAREQHTRLMIGAERRALAAQAAGQRAARQELLGPTEGRPEGGAIDRQLKSLADTYSRGVDKQSVKELSDAYEKAREAYKKDPTGTRPPSDREIYLERIQPTLGKFNEKILSVTGDLISLGDKGLRAGGNLLDKYNENLTKLDDNTKKVSDTFLEFWQKLTGGDKVDPNKPKTGRAGGTMGETGQLLEPKDVMALLHKGEMVLTPEQQKNFLSNARTSAFSDMLSIISQKGAEGGGKIPGIDLQRIAKDIATTTSKVEVTNWPKSMPVQVAGAQSAAPAAKTEEKKPEEKKPATTVKEEKPKATQVSVKAADNVIDKQPKVKEESTSTSTSTTKLTVNGRDVDPNSREGQAAMKQLDESAKKTQEAIQQLTSSFGAGGKTITLDPKSIEDMTKPLGENLKDAAQEIKETAPTTRDVKDIRSSETLKTVAEDVKDTGTTYKEVKGPSMTKKSSAEFLLDNQITQASSGMRGSSAVDKGALNDALSLSEKEREEKKKKYQEEYDLAQKEVSDRDKRLIEIEKRYEDEGRAADAKNDEEYMRLEAQEKVFLQQRGNAQKNLQALKEVDDIKRKVEDQGYDFEKVNANRLQNLTKESAEAVQKEMKEAIPVKDLQGSLAKASESLDEHGKKTLQFVMNDSDELLEVRKRNAKNGIKGEEAEIAERQARIKELENKSFESELTRREKNWIEFQKGEIASAEERKKLRESDLRAIELVEKSRQGILEESNKVTKQAFDTMADDVAEISKVLPETSAQAVEDMEVIADDMRAGIVEALPTKEITQSLSDLTMAADEIGAELAESIPTSQITKSLSDMTMEADEIGADLEKSIPTTSITKSLGDMMMEADEIGADLEKSIPTTSITKSLSDMMMEADEIGSEMSADIESKFKPMQISGLDELEKGDTEESTNAALEAGSKQGINKPENFKAPTIGQLAMDARGMPIVRKTSEVAGQPKQEEAKKAEAAKTEGKKDEGKKDDSKKSDAKGESKQSNKTLDDVYKVLQDLNTNIVKLTSKVEETSKNQITATKTAMSGNLMNR